MVRVAVVVLAIILTPITKVDSQTDCVSVYGVFLEHDQVCVSQIQAYKTIQEHPNYGGVRR